MTSDTNPDFPLTETAIAEATIEDLRARLLKTEAQLAAARSALAAVREVREAQR